MIRFNSPASLSARCREKWHEPREGSWVSECNKNMLTGMCLMRVCKRWHMFVLVMTAHGTLARWGVVVRVDHFILRLRGNWMSRCPRWRDTIELAQNSIGTMLTVSSFVQIETRYS